jgi:hypothetical protein
MMRGQVVPDEARAWTAGLLLASDYFTWARQRALAKASAAIRGRLRRGSAPPSTGGLPPSAP